MTRARLVSLYTHAVVYLIAVSAAFVVACAALLDLVARHCTGIGIVGGAVALTCYRSPLAAALLSAISP